MSSIVRLSLAIAVAAGTASAAWGGATALRDQAQLEALLKSAAPCCIIDARPDGVRKLLPLADTVPYRQDLKINPTSVVVVIADSDAKAVEVGDAIAKTSNAKDVVAVKGGAATWRALVGGDPGASAGSAALSFVIPKNTCEQDTPLQTLIRSKPQ
jgi:hypothetical protein